jgi:hypothetical protein
MEIVFLFSSFCFGNGGNKKKGKYFKNVKNALFPSDIDSLFVRGCWTYKRQQQVVISQLISLFLIMSSPKKKPEEIFQEEMTFAASGR